jgi:2-C-methyl-D-erythritol 4-phosphate cytidylyltransferase
MGNGDDDRAVHSDGHGDEHWDEHWDGERPLPVGVVLEDGRGSLPFALLHGEALVACAAWAMGEAGVQLLDLGTPWQDVVESGAPLVWHDALCPMAPPEFVAACLERACADGAVVVAVLPVTDTVKEIVDGPGGPVVGSTLDRDDLVMIASPLVIPASVLPALGGWPSTDLPTAVAELRQVAPVVLVEAPRVARRVTSEDDVRALEALTAG